MKTYSVVVLALATVGSASPTPLEARQALGNGPYGAASGTTDSGLNDHTIYLPNVNANTAVKSKFPVLVWGNGGCGSDGNSNSKFLSTVASYGYLAIASGKPGGSGGQTTAAMMRASVDFAVKVAGTGKYANVDATKIMAAGFSCGGVEAMEQSWDSRVSTIGIFSSGLLTNYTAASTWTKPTLFVIGGSGDIAYNNAERDYKNMKTTTPVWKGNLPLGHGGDLFNNGGGKFGKAGIQWMEWYFRGDQNAGKYFTEGGSKADNWVVESRSLDKLKPLA